MITIDGYPIDASLSETHTYAADVTSYPVESGATITDNVKPKPTTVELECIVSDSPLAAVLQARRAKNLADPAFQDLPSVEALDRLIAVMTSREPVTIETALKVYPLMVLTSFVPTFDKTTGRALKFSCSLTQVQLVTNLRATVRVASPGTPQSKKKISGPAVVVVNRPGVDERDITTLSGRPASWNDEHGRYEYSSDESSDGGAPVPARDLGDYTKYDNKQTPVPDGGIPDDPSELGANGKPVNSTYFDQPDGAWKNTDSTPVTQEQLQRANGGVKPAGAPDPWWNNSNAKLTKLLPGH